MFKDYKYKHLGYDTKKYSITIIDSEFEEVINSFDNAYDAKIVVETIIKTYSSRSLNVPYNLFLYMLKITNKVNFWNIKNLIKYYQKYIPEYQQYHSQIEKYLLLK